jgi:hypothetical protein
MPYFHNERVYDWPQLFDVSGRAARLELNRCLLFSRDKTVGVFFAQLV